jgi:DNA-binding beta-propeller fold protein YncE
MIDPIATYKRLTLVTCTALAVSAGACGVDSPTPAPPGDPAPDPGDPAPPPPPAVFSVRASRASTIAISDDDTLVAMVNPDDNSLSVFQTSDNSRISKTATGAFPSSVVIAGDNKTAYVANRNDGSIARVINIDSGKPTADAALTVGAEPVGLALAPSGRKLFVADFAASQIVVIDTNSFKISQTIKVDRPRAILVTNNADQSDDDEKLVVAEFFGTPVEGGEAKDTGRTGRILTYALNNLSGSPSEITLSPTDSGFGVMTSPNQLSSMAVAGDRIYITSVSASPQGPTKFNGNVFPVVYVADLPNGIEVRDASGTANLAAKVVDLFNPAKGGTEPSPTNPRFIPGDLSDVAFLDKSQVAYAIGRAGDVMVRLEYGTDLKVGVNQNNEIDLIGNATLGTCQAPTGVAVSKTLGRGYVNCWASRRLGVVEFKNQVLTQTVEASPAPTGADISIQRGKRFFFTGRARWSNDGFVPAPVTDPSLPPPPPLHVGNGAKGGEGWSSCGSCHPDGLTDNVTWVFGSGPRQTTSMDGSFSHGPGVGPQKQRIFNWTAINDELHDFEANVRGVSGGLGAITTGDCSSIEKEKRVDPINTPLAASNKDLTDSTGCKRADWDDITNWVKIITPVHASKLGDAAAIARGRALFLEGGCDNCHSGAGWTVSRRPYSPAFVQAANQAGAVIFGALDFTQTAYPANSQFIYPIARKQISIQPAIGLDRTGPATPEIVVPQVACALRNVGTFGIPTDSAGTTALEKRPPPVGGSDVAQGRAGYNVPSLYGLAVGAPYLHHGQAPSLEELFSDPKWTSHTNAGNTNFFLTLAESGKLADLIKFLLSIDSSTLEISIPNLNGVPVDVCPGIAGQSL